MKKKEDKIEPIKGSYMVYDIETTGLPDFPKGQNRKYYPYNEKEKYKRSRIIQMAYEIYEENGTLKKSFNKIIKPEGFVIPVSKYHNITNEIAQREGIRIQEILDEYMKDLKSVEKIIGHNVEFDKMVTMAEMNLHNRQDIILCMEQKKYECIGKLSTNICKLVWNSRYEGYKMPKLGEAYEYIFKEKLEGWHDALEDVKACARIYKYIKNQENEDKKKISR
jgi:DNA polymerase III, epsilon subunit and related 3''-5'' exonucleases